jgi:hemolysin activation/secretion protein
MLLTACNLHAYAQEPRVAIDEFVVVGNTLLPRERLATALARFKGERTLTELQNAALVVQALYRDAGYGGVVAYLPPQSGAPGKATINVLEGRVSHVYITGNSQFSEANIRRAVPSLREGETPRVRRIDSQIQLANENPARQISLALEPGTQQGEVEARVTVSELPASRWSLALDNTGNESTGRLRASLGYQNSAMFDLDHQLSVQAQFAPDKLDAVAIVSAGYRIPMPESGMTFDLFGAYSDVDGGTATTVAGPLQFSGQGKVIGFRLTRPLERVGRIGQRVSFGIDRRLYLNDCSIVGLPPGACGTAGASVAVHPLSVDYQWQSDGERSFGFSVGYSHNLYIGGHHSNRADFEAVRPGADVHYDTVRFGAFGALPLRASWQLLTRASGQWTDDALVPGEQFGLAGASAVRGYEEREVTGDSGGFVSVEVLTPNLFASKDDLTTTLRLLGFADAGKVFNRLDTPCRLGQSRCSLAAIGLGARLGYRSLQLKLDLAHALKNANTTGRGDTRLHFQAIYAFL